ncbi:MAG: class I SAM-dependent rRNA methyltransferase [Lewinellaceae bacterium]|nr:class I SAM-dependent rRNA methyltransferase [Lewinellaceae bacterium]
MTHKIRLLKNKDASIHRRHPWIFSGAIDKRSLSPDVRDGDVIEVLNHAGQFLCVGHYSDRGSIAVRILSFLPTYIDLSFWIEKFCAAIQYRSSINIPNSHSNAYRLIHGEGDDMPGLIVDVYDDVAVIQCHSFGMYLQSDMIGEALKISLPSLSTIFIRAKETLNRENIEDRYFLGSKQKIEILEHGIRFEVDIINGQKTGFFLDQRENRRLVGLLSKGKTVLNCFSYTGGFSMYALHASASKVVSVDISGKAMEICKKNLEFLGQITGVHEAVTEDVLQYLNRENDEMYDLVIVDPPAFAKSIAKRHNAVQAYKRLNIAAIKKVKSGGMMFTFSCSQVIHTQLFTDTIIAAGIESNRNIRIVQSLSQGPDHPINLFHPEGHYLKGLLVYIT